uniref:ADP-ribosylation factor n=2 Tax=Triticum TaxID=4564 RepID=A0A8R7QNR3_TRIUA
MSKSIILVLANKQDLKGSMSPAEVSEGLGLHDLKNKIWHIQGACAIRGEGIYDGLDWLASTLKQLQE